MSKNGRLSGKLPYDRLLSRGDGVTGGANVFMGISVYSDLCPDVSEAGSQSGLNSFDDLND
jgi:hypothetical protein